MSAESAARNSLLRIRRAQRKGLLARIAIVLANTSHPTTGDALRDLSTAVARFDSGDLWFAIAVLRGELPVASIVRRTRRVLELDGPWAAMQYMFERLPQPAEGEGDKSDIRVVGSDVKLVDITGLLPGRTMAEGIGPGRQLVREWARRDDVVPVAWTSSQRALRNLRGAEAEELGLPARAVAAPSIVIPHRSSYVLAGVVDVPRAAERLIALGELSHNATGSVGYGLRQLIDAHDFKPSEGEERFSWHVAAQRSFDHLAAVGDNIAEHYQGWEMMLPAIGVRGPILHTDFALPSADRAVSSTGAWSELARSVGSAIGIYDAAAAQP